MPFMSLDLSRPTPAFTDATYAGRRRFPFSESLFLLRITINTLK
jgi:hypothetical protein